MCWAGFAYLALASVATSLFGTNAPVWFANAFGVTVLLRHPGRSWAVFLIVFWLGDALALRLFGDGPSLLLALCDTFEMLVLAALTRRLCGPNPSFLNGRQAGIMLLAFLAVPALSSGAGAALLHWTEGAGFLDAWRIWYCASVLGLLVATPVLLGWSTATTRRRALDMLTPARAIAVIAAMAGAMFVVLQDAHPALVFLSFPIVMVTASSFGLVGVTAGVVAVSLAALGSVLSGSGALVAIVGSGNSMEQRVALVQLYLVTVLFSSLPIAMLLGQQRQLAADLRSAGEARSDFLAAMSHEIRTPMTGVLGMIDLLAAEQLPPTHRRWVEAMRASGRHLLSVINDILDFSRIESGRLELEAIDYSLPDLLEQVRSLVHPLAVERGLALDVELQPHSPPVLKGDPTRVTQVLMNLVSNAVKFTHHGGVTIAVRQVEDEEDAAQRLRYEVRDTGVGIAGAQLDHLFEAFTQEDRSISRRYGGSGLGLAICKRLVEAMEGRIGVESRVGVGSCFWFELPLVPGDVEALEQPRRAEARVVEPRRILIAEDVDINRQILAARLGSQGHELVFAEDGAQALARVQQQPFDLVFMDVQMPVMDGVEATRRIRRLPGPEKDIPIVALTANVMARERDRYLGAGMNDCLMKPIEWDQLDAAIVRYGQRGAATAPLAAMAAPTAAPAEVTLLDAETLEGLRAMMGDEQLRALVRSGLATYLASCDALAGTPSATEIHAQMHKVKGSAGTLGLGAVMRMAAGIEAGLDESTDVRRELEELRACIAATRRELEGKGLA
ncbi:ATP-binding protein [Ramlibacter sp. XY19]|uniref:hybrid sensor histidine kinase/response regulator n=1 Tax=Ramlibacter paludis TaxID=2908000 RepID=UPI0023DC384C|nr:ATP-binding protein [Ramlibacter paludis]MCG2594362.1 ATP-binding protein [Ramlibacter paludis]